jgi:hypothetical protein
MGPTYPSLPAKNPAPQLNNSMNPKKQKLRDKEWFPKKRKPRAKDWWMRLPLTALPPTCAAYCGLQIVPALPFLQIGDSVTVYFDEFAPLQSASFIDCVLAWAEEQTDPEVFISVEVDSLNKFATIHRDSEVKPAKFFQI